MKSSPLPGGCHSRSSQPLALHARTHVFSRRSDAADETQIAGYTELAGAGGGGAGEGDSQSL